MKRVATAVVLIPVVFALIFLLSNLVFVLAMALVALIATFEYLRVAEKIGAPPFAITLAIVAGLFLVLALQTNAHDLGLVPIILAFIVLAPFVLLSWPLLSPDFTKSLIGSCFSLMGVLYICLPLASLMIIRALPSLGNYYLVLLLLAVWSGDIAAFYVGKAIGKHKLAPTVSPGKTWEGAVASLVFSVLVVCLVTQLVGPRLSGTKASMYFSSSDFRGFVTLRPPPLWVPICFGLLVNFAAQVGDLAESMLKRSAGVKDSGNLLPGHGGMLDRIDALLFAAPVAMLIVIFAKNFFHTSEGLWISN